NGRELGDPDGDGTIDASIQVTNPGDPNSFVPQQPATPAVTSFVIGGVTLQEDVKNPPVPSGMQRFEVTFNISIKDIDILPDLSLDITFNNPDESLLKSSAFPFELLELLVSASDFGISEDRLKLTGTANLPAGANYQMIIGNPDANLSEAQQYFLGTVELSDAVVSGVGILPGRFALIDTLGAAVLIDPELYSKALMDGTDPFESAIVRISNFNVLESLPEQLAFELKHVPDGSYALFLGQDVVDAQRGTVALGGYMGLNPLTGEVDPASLIQVVDGASVTGLQVMLEEIIEPEFLDIREVSVQSVNAETNSFSIQRNGQQASVDVSQALMITLDQKSVEDILAIFFSGNVDDLAQLIFPITDLMPGDTVSVLGLGLSETAIQALIVIRQVPSQTRSADLDGDGDVDFSDFLLFTASFGTSEGVPGYNAAADLDGDGTVAFSDFLIFANAFGKPVG
ncbi:MAG: dockerin type I domain-containing protein, partial [Gemmatimonadota bacterium]|nr:dockerin type I domain-containing protein [Gemmatimonadota bacterium]